jgi:microcin C transport system permease protein
MIPTLFGILLINLPSFNSRRVARSRHSRAIAEASIPERPRIWRGRRNRKQGAGDMSSKYRGAQGLDPKFIAELESNSASTSRL